MATAVAGTGAPTGAIVVATDVESAGAIAGGAIDEAIVREARRVLMEDDPRILTFRPDGFLQVFVEPIPRTDLIERLMATITAGGRAADVIDLDTSLHTLVFDGGVLHGRAGLTDDVSAAAAAALRDRRSFLFEDQPRARRYFIRLWSG